MDWVNKISDYWEIFMAYLQICKIKVETLMPLALSFIIKNNEIKTSINYGFFF